MIAVRSRAAPRRQRVAPSAPVDFDPSDLPQLRLWTPSTGATGGGATAYASASSQYHFVTDKNALRVGTTGIGIVGQFLLTTTGADQGLAGKCGATADPTGLEYGLQYIASASRFRFTIGTVASIVSVDANTLGAPVAGTWYSIAAWYDPAGGGTLNIAVNGGAVDTAVCPVSPQGAANEFRIGRVGAAYLNGRARSVAVIRRPPTGPERTALHNGGAGCAFAAAPSSLKTTWALGGWWDLAILKAGQKAFDQVRLPNLAPKTPNGMVRGTTAPPAGFSAYQTLTQAATSYLGGLAVTYPATAFPTEINHPPAGTTMRVRVRRADTDVRHQALWISNGGGTGLVIKDNKLSWWNASAYLNGGAAQPTLAAGVWYDVGMTFNYDGHSILVVDGAVVHTWYSSPGSLTMDTIGGRTTTNIQTLNGDLCGAEYYQANFTPQHWADLHAGNAIPFLPFTAYRMDEGGSAFDDYGRQAADLTASGSPTPADPPALTAITDGFPVRRLADVSGGGRHMLAPSAEPADYAGNSSRLPLLGMPCGIRCDQQGPKRLAAVSVMGTVTEFTLAVAGLLSHPVDAGGLQTGGQGKIVPIVGCSNNGLYGTAVGDAWAILGYQEGRAGNSELYWKFYFAVRAPGGPTVVALAQQPHPFGHTLIARYKGGQYLSLAYNGVEIARATTSVPASLALTGDFTWGKVASYFASGHQLHDQVVCNQAISDAQVSQLHNYWAAQMQIVPVQSAIAYDAGPWNGTNPNGFNQMAGLVKCNNGDIILTFLNSIADPSAQTGKAMLMRSTDGGASWDAGVILEDGRPTYDPGTGESFFKLHTSVGPRLAGDIGFSHFRAVWNTTSLDYPVGSISAWIKWSSDHGRTWTAPTSIPTPAGFLDLAIFGKAFQRPNGDIWVTGYARYNPTTWHSVIMRSIDGGVTWSLMKDMQAATGGSFLTELAVIMFDDLGFPNEGIAIARGGGIPPQTRTYDNAATFERYMLRDGSSVNVQYEDSTPNLLLDEQGRLISIIGQRNVYYDTNGKVVRWGLRIQVSLDKGVTWGPIVMLFDCRGRTNNGSIIDGAYLITASVDETGKIRTYRFPAAALPDVTTP